MEELTSWLKANVRPGLVLPVHHGAVGLEWFQLGEVTGVNREKGRIYVKNSGVFYFTGRNCSDPKGQVYLVMPTSEAIEAACRGTQMINGDPSFAPKRQLSEYEKELAARYSGAKGN